MARAAYGFSLGEKSKPEGGTLARRQAPPRRPNVIDEGIELEVVWYPHRDAAPLLTGPSSYYRDSSQLSGDAYRRPSLPWSWLG